MWRGWRGDLLAALIGLALFPALLYATGGVVLAAGWIVGEERILAGPKDPGLFTR